MERYSDLRMERRTKRQPKHGGTKVGWLISFTNNEAQTFTSYDNNQNFTFISDCFPGSFRDMRRVQVHRVFEIQHDFDGWQGCRGCGYQGQKIKQDSSAKILHAVTFSYRGSLHREVILVFGSCHPSKYISPEWTLVPFWWGKIYLQRNVPMNPVVLHSCRLILRMVSMVLHDNKKKPSEDKYSIIQNNDQSPILQLLFPEWFFWDGCWNEIIIWINNPSPEMDL